MEEFIEKGDHRQMNKVSTGMYDKDGNEIFLGNKIALLTGDIGEIVFECGAYGVGISDGIDYDKLQAKMDESDWYCGNNYCGCFNDNFVSLWELYWNFNCEDNCLYPIVQIVGGWHYE